PNRSGARFRSRARSATRNRPGLGHSQSDSKHIIVKTPVTDRRAADFLTSEAKQLPTGEPGLVVLDMAASPDSFDNWETILRGRLQPSMHTRVSAVLLTRSSVQAGAEHVHWIVSKRLIENP